jgi:sugar phosphate isomerase/epimerase
VQTAFTPGLVSITFRQLSPAEIVSLARKAQLQEIEWGGDIHVPHGDIARARQVGAMTCDAGLSVAAYGSYYAAGASSPQVAFEQVLETAVALGAPLIRVWAGREGSAAADAAARQRVVADTAWICDLAAEAGVTIAFEYHGGTLTDTPASARALLTAVNRPNLRSLWQPLGDADPAGRALVIEEILPWLSNIHVFYWPSARRAPLSEGAGQWQAALTAAARGNRPTGLLLEFVADDSPEQFLSDAATLRRWLSGEWN